MKKIIFILLLCFALAFMAFAVPMSPHPGDMLETVLTVEDDVTMVGAEAAPAFENGLHLEQINNFDTKICLSENEVIGTTILSPDFNAEMAVAYIGSEMVNILYKPGEDVFIYKTEFG